MMETEEYIIDDTSISYYKYSFLNELTLTLVKQGSDPVDAAKQAKEAWKELFEI